MRKWNWVPTRVLGCPMADGRWSSAKWYNFVFEPCTNQRLYFLALIINRAHTYTHNNNQIFTKNHKYMYKNVKINKQLPIKKI